ncbi:MAG: MFS transporter [Methanotrichaceae archaeon]
MELTVNIHARQLLIFILLAFLIDVSYGTITVAIPLYLASLNKSAIDFGLIVGVASIGSLLIKIPLGILSDKIGKKFLIFLGFVILLISNVLFPIYLDGLAVLRIFQGLALSLIWVPFTVLFIDTFRDASKIAYYTGAYMTGSLAGSLLGGLLPQYMGYQFTFSFSAGILILCTPMLFLISESKTTKDKARIENRSNPVQMIYAWLLGTANIAAGMIFLSFMPLFAYTQLHSSSSEIGMLIFLEGLVYALLAVPAGRMIGRSENLKLLLAGNAAILIVFSMFYFSYNLAELAIVSVMFGAISAVVLPISMSMASESMSDKGKAMGIYQTCYDIGCFIGPSLAGMTAAAFSIRHAFFAIVPIIVLSFILILITGMISKPGFSLGNGK